MADWYVSSAAYNAVPAFQTTHAYSIGDIIRPTAAIYGNRFCYRCTTAGTSAASEPSWTITNNATTTSGGATFTCVGGQSTYGWSACAGDVVSITNTPSGTPRISAAGDRTFVSQDHTETAVGGSYNFGCPTTVVLGFGLVQVLCVNRAGSVPPVAADLTTGAQITVTSGGNLFMYARCMLLFYGITFSAPALWLADNGGTGGKTVYLKNCQLILTASAPLYAFRQSAILDNTPVIFTGTGQSLQTYAGEVTQINTPNSLQGGLLAPNSAISYGYQSPGNWIMRGVDISSFLGILHSGNSNGSQLLLHSCRIAGAMTRYTPTGQTGSADEVELINCYDGSHFINEIWVNAGAVTTDFVITLAGGAQDDIAPYAFLLTSNQYVSKFAPTTLVQSFWMDVEIPPSGVGFTRTATVEIVSSQTLNNDDIALYLEYRGTAGSPVLSFADSFIGNPLATPTAVPSS